MSDEVLIHAWASLSAPGVVVSVETDLGRSDYTITAERATLLARQLSAAADADRSRPRPARRFTIQEIDEILREVADRLGPIGRK